MIFRLKIPHNIFLTALILHPFFCPCLFVSLRSIYFLFSVTTTTLRKVIPSQPNTRGAKVRFTALFSKRGFQRSYYHTHGRYIVQRSAIPNHETGTHFSRSLDQFITLGASAKLRQTVPQIGRSLVRSQLVSLEFFH